MNLHLSETTKTAFFSLISGMDFDKIKEVFKKFIEDTQPLSMSEFGSIMNVSESQALEMITNKGERNEKGEVVGFLGFSLVPTSHKMIIDGKSFYTWCAADTLLFPGFLGFHAEIISADPISDETIHIRVNNETLEKVEPPTTMISWVDDVDQNDIRCSMCNRVHFFASQETAAKWHSTNPDARIFSVIDFFIQGLNPKV